jgi:hypothetical protein
MEIAGQGGRPNFRFDIFAFFFREDVLTRIVVAAACFALLATACAPREAEPSAAEPPPATAADPIPQPAAEPAAPTPDTRIAALNLSCGGENFRVAFEDARAVVVNVDGSNTELAKLPADANSAAGVETFTNGAMTFTRQGGQDSPAVIKFARGRMAFQDCAIA